MKNMYEIDAPINKIDDDKLNRLNFVEILSESIINYDEEECLVIGLMGEWGCGKTSIINMVFNEIEKFNKKQSSGEEVLKINFSPWYFSNRDNILYHFLDFLNDKLNENNIKKEFSDKLAEFKYKFIRGSSFKLGFNGTGMEYNDPDSTIKIYKSFNSIKNQLMNLFSELNYKIVISIDDIDRLTDNEIQQVFLLVKSLADFPHVVYILSFDKNVVVNALNNLQIHTPEKFLEKIIQIPILVPDITKTRLHSLIMDKIKPIYIENNKLTYDDFNEIFSIIKPFFHNVRDLKRYNNILNFYLKQFKDEINIGDFLIIVAIQLFEDEIYIKIRDNKDILTNYNESNSIEDVKIYYNKFLDEINNPKKYDKSKINLLMFKLFPILKLVISEDYYGDEEFFASNLNICSEKHFDKYFTLSIEKNEVSQIIVDNLLDSDDIEKMYTIICSIIQNDKLTSLLDKLQDSIYKIEDNTCKLLINILLTIGDYFNHVPNICAVVDSLCFKVYSEDIFYILKEIFQCSKTLYTCCYLINFIGNKYGLYYGDENKLERVSFLSIDQFKELINIAYKRIITLSENEKLFDDENFIYFLDFWKMWGTKEEVKTFVDELATSNLISLLNKFKIYDGPIEDINYANTEIFDYGRLYALFDPEELLIKIKELLSKESLSSEDYEFCQIFIEDYYSGGA